jgi:AcrR family transcriptional regulator
MSGRIDVFLLPQGCSVIATSVGRIAKRESGRSPALAQRGERIRDAEATREDILEAATEEFADKGLSGARIDKIADRTSTSKRMIYYYFGSKDALYRAVLEREYTRIRRAEAAIALDRLDPEKALAELVRQSFDSHLDRPNFIRLVMNENIHHAEHLKQVKGLNRLNKAMIKSLGEIIDRGVKARVFRRGIDAVDLHINITALCFYTVSNRYTFRQGFALDMWAPREIRKRREQVVDVILRWCASA